MHPHTRPGPVARVLIAILGGYRRWVSPLFLPHCRFHPTCSAYAVDALRHHGVLRGTWLAVVRLAKCAPWHPGGLDPVPPPRGGAPAKSPDETRDADPPSTTRRGAGAPTTEERAPC